MSEAVPQKRICKVCGQLPPGKFCNECKFYQDWRRGLSGLQIPLTMLTLTISVLTSLITAGTWSCYHHSKTSATLISAATAGISVYVWNTGRNPSVVLKCTLRYSGASNEEFNLDFKPETGLIPAEGHSIIPLVPIAPKNPAAVKAAILILTVQESSGHAKDLPSLPLSNNFVIQVHNM
ncbi:MAG TPA: hypothetical protein VG323_10930 [Thermoanaerobaculia bacterium]|nr:hypothetical protein [Thermoanaerobaculia bacterium]